MDRIDCQILNLLQANSRCTLRCIGEQVGLTAPAVAARIRTMEEEGVIRGYHADIDRTMLDFLITGFIYVSLRQENPYDFYSFCVETPSVISCHCVSGEFNALLQFAVKNTEELDMLLTEIKRYGDSRTSVKLKTRFNVKDIPVPRLKGDKGR